MTRYPQYPAKSRGEDRVNPWEPTSDMADQEESGPVTSSRLSRQGPPSCASSEAFHMPSPFSGSAPLSIEV
jgi:hypothetical protein